MNDTTIPAPSPGKGSAGNVLAAICSFFLPGLGQLVQGRMSKAIWHGILGAIGYGVSAITCIPAFIIMSIWSCYEAAVHKPDPLA